LNYIANTVDGFVRAGESEQAVGQTINLGTGRAISVGDLAQLIAHLVGRGISVESDSQRVRPEKSEVDQLIAANGRAQELLGWQPRVSLEDGLQLTIDWLRSHLERYRPGVYSV
jgi:dTDP-glucose 4,6-dehydratase